MRCAAEPKARARRHGQRTSALHMMLTPCVLRAPGAPPRAVRLVGEQIKRHCRGWELPRGAKATMRWRSMAASTRDGMAAHAQGSSLSLSPWRRCIGAAASALHGGNQGLREGARVEGEGRVGRLEGWAGWAGPCESARAVGGVLLLLRVLRHRRWSASSTVAYAVAALCARARARECASVLRQACVCPRLAAMFKTKCARERRVAEYVLVTDCRVITSPLFTFLLGANPSASTLR